MITKATLLGKSYLETKERQKESGDFFHEVGVDEGFDFVIGKLSNSHGYLK